MGRGGSCHASKAAQADSSCKTSWQSLRETKGNRKEIKHNKKCVIVMLKATFDFATNSEVWLDCDILYM